MSTSELFPCLGIELLGSCKYDPQAPFATYFTIGDAIAALAFTLAIQQLLKPIYLFRILSIGIKLKHVTWAVFVGATCSLVAAVVPNISFLHHSFWGYPLNWEIIGGSILGTAYGVVAWISLRQAKLTTRNLHNFTMAGAHLLSESTDDDRLSFAKDIFAKDNLKTLCAFTAEFKRARQHAFEIEFEKLSEKEKLKGIVGQPPMSAFYAFARQKQLQQASDATFLLGILTDPEFCRVVVTRCPWRFLNSIFRLARSDVDTEVVNQVVQAVAWQALLQPESMLAREVGYDGFAQDRVFSREFFGSVEMLRFRLFDGAAHKEFKPTSDILSRLNLASSLMIRAETIGKNCNNPTSSRAIRDLYGRFVNDASREIKQGRDVEYLFELEMGVNRILQLAIDCLSGMDERHLRSLFRDESKKRRDSLFDDVAAIFCSVVSSLSYDFSPTNHRTWGTALELFEVVFPRYGTTQVGIDPLQQRASIFLQDRLRENLKGGYQPITPVLLNIFWPSDRASRAAKGTAFQIMQTLVFAEMARFRQLYKSNKEFALQCLPNNISYVPKTNSLVRTFGSGSVSRISLSKFESTKINLFDEGLFCRSVSVTMESK